MVEMAGLRWWNWLVCDGEIGCFYSSANTMPRDADIDLLYDVYSSSPKQGDGRPEWGDRAVWEELNRKDPFPFWLD